MRVAGLFLMLLCLGGCAVGADRPGVRTYAWPFYQDQYLPGDQSRASALGPFVDVEKRGSYSRVSVRPFYSYTVDPSQYQREQLFFYPISQYRERERPGWPGRKETRFSLLPFFWWNDVSFAPGHRELDYFFFPLVFGGQSTIEGSHFAVAPFGGNLKGVFGNDEVRFVMFPLYVELRRQGRVTYYLPFPIVRWGYGPGYRTYGVMPLFSRTEVWREVKDEITGGTKKVPVADRWSVLWPIFRYDRDSMDRKYPREALMVYPLFGYTSTAVTTNLSMLFILNYPMFSYTRADLTDTTIIDAFWPVFRYAKGDQFTQYRLWPLWDYSVRDFGRGQVSTAINVLWPLFWYFEDRLPEYEETRYQVFPLFFANFKRYLPEPDGTVRTKDLVRIWPLAKYRKDLDDTVSFEMLSIFPFNSERFDNTYGPFFRFFSVKAGPKETQVQALFRIFSYEQDPYRIDLSLAPLFHWHVEKQARDRLPHASGPQPGDVESFDLLYGLLGYHHGPQDRYTRLFWGLKVRAPGNAPADRPKE
ncbi:MAG: hypothetical protein IT463_08980 [Planctomycetes bacterium]|nr:hypothetical protein [Planctomycetota bacterium]